MISPRHDSTRSEALRAAAVLFLGVPLVYALGALTAVLSIPRIEHAGGVLEEQLLRKGPDTFMLRVTMIWMLLGLPILLRAAGWRGRRDVGWHSSGAPGSVQAHGLDLLRGLGLGFASLGVAVTAMLALGTRTPDTPFAPGAVAERILVFSISCITVALIEETVARGILFRSLARTWNVWAAGGAISILFAVAHFLRPLPEAFEGETVPGTVWSVLCSLFSGYTQTADVWIRSLNLTLMSGVLCAFVWRTGTIWVAVGAHAAWVWVKRMNGYLTDHVPDADWWSRWAGQKSDATDALFASAILAVLLAAAVLVPRREGS